VTATGLAAVALAACGSSGSGTPASTAPTASSATTGSATTGSATTGAAASGSCDYTASPGDAGGRHPGLPPTTPLQTTGTATATVVTSAGTIVFTMDAAKTPCTLGSFRFLADHHYFDGTHCHRLTTSGIFVLQCGDPAGNGTGGPGYTIPDENLTGATYPAGSLAMANTGSPHTGGSQFFINYDNSPLPATYTPFGTVTQGLSVLQAIGKAGTADGSQDGAPKTAVNITSFTVSPPPS
jgi:peptidyl-prolyl cis-trans isomerase B (cyclophilin B)